jgi:hypothetical protein
MDTDIFFEEGVKNFRLRILRDVSGGPECCFALAFGAALQSSES